MLFGTGGAGRGGGAGVLGAVSRLGTTGGFPKFIGFALRTS